MAEKDKKVVAFERSDEEKAAAAALIRAETEWQLAKVREANSIASMKELQLESTEAEALRIREAEAIRRANDEYNFIYRFYGAVTISTVDQAIQTLTAWHRLNEGVDLEIIFNSPGGSVIDGFELFDFIVDLRANGHQVTTGCTGMAASMAGILVQAGDIRWMSRESWYMIHRAAFGAVGKTFEVEDTVEWIKRIEARIQDIFVARSKLTKREITKKWDRKDWWISSDEALAKGLVDEVRSSGLVPVSTDG